MQEGKGRSAQIFLEELLSAVISFNPHRGQIRSIPSSPHFTDEEIETLIG